MEQSFVLGSLVRTMSECWTPDAGPFLLYRFRGLGRHSVCTWLSWQGRLACYWGLYRCVLIWGRGGVEEPLLSRLWFVGLVAYLEAAASCGPLSLSPPPPYSPPPPHPSALPGWRSAAWVTGARQALATGESVYVPRLLTWRPRRAGDVSGDSMHGGCVGGRGGVKPKWTACMNPPILFCWECWHFSLRSPAANPPLLPLLMMKACLS